MTTSHSERRRLLVPEVVQTSAMDCGPAVLSCLLEGFGIPVSYGRLREACQTDVDGTSIDVLEEVAGQLGLAAEQVMIPGDHLLLAEAGALPAIVVISLPNGLTHFVLVWRRHGPLVQVMDPAVGRRWITGRRLLEELYVHTLPIPAEDWRDWAVTDEFRRPLARRLHDLRIGRPSHALIETAATGPGWHPLARLDAATRFVASLVRAGGLGRGREARQALASFLEHAGADAASGGWTIPDTSWSARPAPPGPDGRDRVLLRGAVIIRVRGRVAPGARPAGGPVALGPELATALAEPTSRPGWALLRCLRGGVFSFGALAVGLVLAAGGAVLEALLLRGAIGIGRDLGLVTQRLQAVGLVLAVAVALLLIERGVADNLARLGRHLEGRLRLAFLAKIPRLHDRYFQSRPISDMAGRSHTLHQVRLLPRLAGQFLRAALTLGITAAAIARIDPAAAPAAALAAVVALGLPLAFTPVIQELDLRARTHAGALSRFYLDALLGLAAVRAHGAEWPVRREHESLLVEWARASQRLLGWVVAIEGWQLLSGLGFAGWLLRRHTDQVHGAGAALLLAYWALNIPVLGEEIALLVRQYPSHRNVILRLLEPLGAPEDDTPAAGRAAIVPPGTDHEPDGVAITFDGVTVRAAGQMILQEIDLRIAAGSQVAIVGASGAGKSSLVGLLLGWHRAAVGRVLIDGEPLDASRLDRLRGETAWVEPAVQLWNRSLAENLLYGTPGSGLSGLGHTLEEADLYEVLRRLPEGLQTSLGEGGGCLSGGEGQRVRFGRALSRSRARLVLLDEPFRGLDRERRRALLHRARRLWRGATLLCITHDVGETCDFDRVLVLEAGRVAEDGLPGLLAQAPTSRYRALLDAEEAVQAGLWSGANWCRLRLEGGHLYGGEPGGRA